MLKRLLALSAVVLSLSMLQANEELELINKHGKTIWFTVENSGKVSPVYKTPDKGKQFVNLDKDKRTILRIYLSDPSKPAEAGTGLFGRAAQFLQTAKHAVGAVRPYKEFDFKKAIGKKLYVTFGPQGELYPQTGPVWGIFGTTSSGKGKSNIVTQKGITEVVYQ